MWNEQILIEAGCSPGVVAHCVAVSRAAVSLAGRVRGLQRDPDIELVRLGGLLHDIGRSRTSEIDHALAGVEIGRQLGFPQDLLNIIERHIGAGITAEEAARLGLPRKDYLPLTPEEKIVSYADNLTKGAEPMQFNDAMDRFVAILGREHEGIALFRRQHEEIQGWMRQQTWAARGERKDRDEKEQEERRAAGGDRGPSGAGKEGQQGRPG